MSAYLEQWTIGRITVSRWVQRQTGGQVTHPMVARQLLRIALGRGMSVTRAIAAVQYETGVAPQRLRLIGADLIARHAKVVERNLQRMC